MVQINLPGGYIILSDSHQWILAKQAGDRISNVGYYVTLPYCIESYFQLRLRLSEAKSIHEFILFHKTLVSSLHKVLHPLEFECVTNVSRAEEVKNG